MYEDNVLDEGTNEDVLADDSIFEDSSATSVIAAEDEEEGVEFDSFDDSPDW